MRSLALVLPALLTATALAQPTFAEEIDGVIYMHEPGHGFYVINHKIGVFHFCLGLRGSCIGPKALPHLHLTFTAKEIEELGLEGSFGGIRVNLSEQELQRLVYLRSLEEHRGRAMQSLPEGYTLRPE